MFVLCEVLTVSQSNLDAVKYPEGTKEYDLSTQVDVCRSIRVSLRHLIESIVTLKQCTDYKDITFVRMAVGESFYVPLPLDCCVQYLCSIIEGAQKEMVEHQKKMMLGQEKEIVVAKPFGGLRPVRD